MLSPPCTNVRLGFTRTTTVDNWHSLRSDDHQELLSEAHTSTSEGDQLRARRPSNLSAQCDHRLFCEDAVENDIKCHLSHQFIFSHPRRCPE